MSTTRHQLRHMTWIPGGTFAMGSAGFYPEERPVHPVTVDFTPRHASATDGGCCAPHNPRVDTPAASGIFTVTLTVSNAGGTSVVTHTVTVSDPAPAPPVASFNFHPPS